MQLVVKDRDIQPGAVGIDWYAAYVKHQHERKVAESLRKKGLEVFLPEQKVVHRWKDRDKAIYVPLFPGYLFLHFNIQDKLQALNTPGIFFLLESAGRACPISGDEIDAIRKALAGGFRIQPHPFVTSGDLVRITAGPLQGITGILTHIKNQYRVVLNVDALRKAVSVEVEIGSVERIQAARRN
jgi:transcription antitermination factor NusG